MSEPDEMSDSELAELAKKVADRLERRGVVAGGAGIAAGSALGWLASGEARAGSDQVGTIGTSSSPVDIEAEDISIVSSGNLADNSGNAMLDSVATTGQTTLSAGAAVVDTGISATDATFTLALGIDDPDADAKVTGRLFWDDSAGTYKIELLEDGTSVGNPTVNYDVVRVR